MVSVTLEIPDEVHSQLLGEALSLGIELDELLVTRLLPPDLDQAADGVSQTPSEDPFEDIQSSFLKFQQSFQHRMVELQFEFLELQRQAVQRSLETVRDIGLIQGHHFYIAFRTTAPGVELGESLRANHPETMTIVLEEQFSSLEVDAEGFSVSLWFGGVPRRLGVPYGALLAFVDPSTEFQLGFPQLQMEPEEGEAPQGDGQRAAETSGAARSHPRAATEARDGTAPDAPAKGSDKDRPADATDDGAKKGKPAPSVATGELDEADDEPKKGGDNVISFADFRRPGGPTK